jgi:hypothetical protein
MNNILTKIKYSCQKIHHLQRTTYTKYTYELHHETLDRHVWINGASLSLLCIDTNMYTTQINVNEYQRWERQKNSLRERR